MKLFEIAVKGEHEEEIGHKILVAVYAAIQEYGYTDVSVQADTIEDHGNKSYQIPAFMKLQHKQGNLERSMAGRRE